ncbi:MAG: 50S ribosomal protein L24 [Oscillospiraceae bacterium]|nr:50S ribosomal protein L24 [Oscillospiraceae bacterium]
MNSLNIRKDDQVVVLSGKDKGAKGKVLSTIPSKGTVIVEKINLATRHTKPRKQGEAGGLIKMESPIRANKVMRICPKCDAPTRTAYAFDKEGKKTRVCKKCKENI